jgi:hypothetical protein
LLGETCRLTLSSRDQETSRAVLIVLGPPFDGTDAEYAELAGATGLLVYDLKTKLKPGAWGVVRALADERQAAELADRLVALGFRACVIDAMSGHDPERRMVNLKALELGTDELVLHLRERVIPVKYRALATIVRGEVRVGRPSGRATGESSSAAMRAVAPTSADIAQFRESVPSSSFDAFAAADLHFLTVFWVARIDARSFDFASLGLGRQSPAADLEQLVNLIAERARIRVDRNARVSSVASFAARPAPMRSNSPVPGGAAPARAGAAADEQFDAYSRLVAEAERKTRHMKISARA